LEIANPEAFLLFIPLIYVFWVNIKNGVRFRSRIFTPTESWMKDRPKLQAPTPFKIHISLRFLGLSFLIFALSRPQAVSTREKRTVDALDMVICFDLSKSMDALDFRPNRREVAIKVISQFIDRRKDDRIGLVLFSGEAYTAVPMTLDHDVVKQGIRSSSNNYLQDGTAIGQALAVAVNHLKGSVAKSKIVILVTDGDNNMGSVAPMTAADLAKGHAVRVYTIGLGKKGKVQYPVTRIIGGSEQVIYQTLTDASNDELLTQMAEHTGGTFYSATQESMLSSVFETIDKLEKTKVETQTYVRRSELAWPWLLLGLGILFLEIIALNTRWRKIP